MSKIFHQVYVGYPHIVYDITTNQCHYPCSIEILESDNGDISLGWTHGKIPTYSDNFYDFLGEELPFYGEESNSEGY